MWKNGYSINFPLHINFIHYVLKERRELGIIMSSFKLILGETLKKERKSTSFTHFCYIHWLYFLQKHLTNKSKDSLSTVMYTSD